MSRMRTLLVAAAVAAVALVMPAVASAAPGGERRPAIEMTWYWAG